VDWDGEALERIFHFLEALGHVARFIVGLLRYCFSSTSLA